MNFIIRIFLLVLVFIACNNPENSGQLRLITRDSLPRYLVERGSVFLHVEDWQGLGSFLDSIQPTVNKENDGAKMYWILQKVQQMKRQDKKDSVDHFLSAASGLSQSLKIKKKELLNFYIVYGNLIHGKDLIDSAIKIATNAYHLAIQLDSFRYAEACYDLAKLYSKIDDDENYKKYVFEAWRCRNREPELTAYIAGSIAAFYDYKNQVDSALYFLKPFEDTSLIWNSELRTWSHENKAYFLSKQGKYEEAIEYLFKAKAINEQNYRDNSNVFFYLADTYSDLNQFGEGLRYTDSARFIGRERKNLGMVKLAWKTKAELFAKKKEFNNAYAALDSAYTTYETEMDSSLRTTARELETRYAVREKDNAIKSLALTNQANLKIRSQQKVIILAMAIAALSFGVIGFLLIRRRQTQMLLRETNLKQQVLRSQMDPHFIANSLSVLQGFIRNIDTSKAVEYNLQLARLLRLSFDIAGKSFVPIKDEIDFLNKYLALLAIQWDNKFEYRIDVYPAYENDNIFIPPMILQPFVENAVMHGFANVNYKGMIIIKITREEHFLHCIVEDNGIGLQEAELGVIKWSHSTDITKQRLMLLSRKTGRPAKLDIIDKMRTGEGTGVRISVEIPLLDKKNLVGINRKSFLAATQ